jgi:predicted RNase H-like HicB family nuclease
MLTAYINAAMRRAHYELLDDQPDDPYYGEIPDLQGVLAIGPTLEACRDELQSALEDWIIFRIERHYPIPPLDGVDLHGVITPPVEEAA